MEEEIICNDCGWTGDTTMLLSETDVIEDPCNMCPDCGSTDIEDLEDYLVICITDELDYYDKGVKYEVYRWEKEDDNIWITDNSGNSDCWSEKEFLMYFKWI